MNSEGKRIREYSQDDFGDLEPRVSESDVFLEGEKEEKEGEMVSF